MSKSQIRFRLLITALVAWPTGLLYTGAVPSPQTHVDALGDMLLIAGLLTALLLTGLVIVTTGASYLAMARADREVSARVLESFDFAFRVAVGASLLIVVARGTIPSWTDHAWLERTVFTACWYGLLATVSLAAWMTRAIVIIGK